MNTQSYKNPALFFSDGETKIDMILAYEDDHHHHDDDHGDWEKSTTPREKRMCFEANLKKQGLLLETEPHNKAKDRKTTFVKVSAPWNIQKKYAEILNLKMPIKIEEDDEEPACFGIMKRLSEPFDYDYNLIPPEPNFFTAGFMMDREDRYIIKDREEFFSGAQRSLIVWQILLRTKYDDNNSDKVGIKRLLSNGVYKAAYPLHDGKYIGDEKGQLSDRMILYKEWAQLSKWYKKQPLWLIKRYFGDKIGLYFAWLGFYTVMLIPAAIVGFLVFLYGVISLFADTNYPSEEICDESGIGNLTMCPQCDTYCPTWTLRQSCTLARFTYIFDNDGTVVFAVFMSLWATMFLEFWKRQQAVIGWEWDLTTFEEDEQMRPEYETKVKTTRINPVTKKPEPYLSPWNKAARVAFTSSFVILMLCAVIMAVIGVMVYRIAVSAAMYQVTKDSVFYSSAKLLISLSAAVLNLILIVLLNKAYQYVALWLTNLEQPRTQTDFEDSYTFKTFLFQCINFYSSLLYIAFFKGKFFTYPGDMESRRNIFTQFANDVCDPAGCFYELCIQLIIIMGGKQMFNNFIELLLPKIQTWWRRHIYSSSAVRDQSDDPKEAALSRWELDYSLTDVGRLALLDEYLEMVIQYGFVTLFVAAFPLAPLLALINNVIEIRLDAYKLVTTTRRPLAQRSQDIGAWFGILQTITYISVVTNGITIALTSDFIPKYVYRHAFSEDNTMRGYVNFSLSAFNTADWGDPSSPDFPGPEDGDYPDVCYFKGLRRQSPDYRLDEAWYHITSARCAFVLVFEHVVLGITGLVAVLIPDIPSNVKVQIRRERLVAREILFEEEERNSSDFGMTDKQRLLYPNLTDDNHDHNVRHRMNQNNKDDLYIEDANSPPTLNID